MIFYFRSFFNRRHQCTAWLLVITVLAAQLSCGGGGDIPYPGSRGTTTARPHFEPGFNLFSPEQDVELGRQSAQQIAQQTPLLNDEQTVDYVRRLGAKLAAKAPGFKFPYQFNVVATKDVNAFALPGGFAFVNAGAIVAAKNEGELVGVMAHEISHVALRHGTNQASKAYVAQAGLGVLGALAGNSPDLAQVIGAIGGAGANMIFLKFGRTAEKQADLQGARIMAEAGYDPRDMAGFFQTLQARSGQRVPEFLSDHPDPGNRIAAINAEVASLPVSANPTRTSPEFEQIKARLTGTNRSLRSQTALSTNERTGPRDPNNNTAGARPQPPAATFNDFRAPDNAYALRYPANWDVLTADQENIIMAPKGAYGQTGQSLVVTHGLFVGAVSTQAGDLESTNAAFVQRQIESNPDFGISRPPQRIDFNGRPGYATVVAGPSTVTGVREIDVIYTSTTSDGRLFYFIAIAPEDEFQTYQASFDQIMSSLQFAR